MKGDVVVGTIVLAHWDENYIHQIRAAQYVPTAEVIDDALAVNPNNLLIGLSNAGDSDFNSVQVCWAVYVPPLLYPLCWQQISPPFRPVLASLPSHKKKFIFAPSSTGSMCHSYTVVISSLNQRLILSIRDTTSLLVDANLLLHQHKLLVRDLPGLNLALECAQGTLIGANIGDVVLR